MPSLPPIKIENIIAPIKGDNPSGEYLRFIGAKGPYAKIKEACREDDGKRVVVETKPKKADWPAVVKIASDALVKETKDLEIAGFLALGLVHCYGFPGLRAGLEVLAQFHEKFWDTVYPLIEMDDLELRSGPLEGLTKKLTPAIKMIPFIEVPGQQGLTLIDSKRQEFQEIVGSLRLEEIENALAEVAECQQQLQQLEKIVDQRYLEMAILVKKEKTFDPPSLIPLRESIEDCLRLLTGIIEGKGGSLPTGTSESLIPTESGPAPGGASFAPSLGPKNREEAIQQLLGVAEFFRRNEPLSPIAFLVQRAARWGQLSFDQWLEEMIKKDYVLKEVKDLLGIRDGEINPLTGSKAEGEKVFLETMVPSARGIALQHLADIGNYFRAVEPQSPIAYLLNRAVKWGKMSLDEWLQEVVRDGDQLREVKTILGIPGKE